MQHRFEGYRIVALWKYPINRRTFDEPDAIPFCLLQKMLTPYDANHGQVEDRSLQITIFLAELKKEFSAVTSNIQ